MQSRRAFRLEVAAAGQAIKLEKDRGYSFPEIATTVEKAAIEWGKAQGVLIGIAIERKRQETALAAERRRTEAYRQIGAALLCKMSDVLPSEAEAALDAQAKEILDASLKGEKGV